jgi:hypothetical protein
MNDPVRRGIGSHTRCSPTVIGWMRMLGSSLQQIHGDDPESGHQESGLRAS